VFPLHQHLLVEKGVSIIDKLRRDDPPHEGVHAFLFILLPVRYKDATASPVRPAAAYTTNAQVFPPNSDVIAGLPGIQTFWQGAMHMGIKAVKLETLEVDGAGQMAHEVGRYTLQGEGDQVIDAGKYVVIWQQEGGQWKLHRDIWNSSQPTPGR
jgi:ketosteroid isomerase-like protein